MKKTPKEGRGRTTPNEMPTKIGREMFFSLKNFGKTGFSPFLEESYLSKEFYLSNPDYQKMNFGSFQNHARRVAEQVIAVMTDAERKIEEARLARKLKEDEAKITTVASIQNTTTSPPNRSNSRVQSLRDTIVAAYPNGEMAIVIFELDGDIDGRAFELQFANNGQQIAVRSRVPVELTKAELLLCANKDRKPMQDADSMLLNQVIKERLKGCEKDKDGILWELREIIDLPFPCKRSLYNRIGNEIPSYLLRENKKGYAWGYFWVVGEHVGNKEEGPTTIRCKASSDDESDDESVCNDTTSQQESTENDFQDMSVQYESLSDDSSIEEIEHNLKQGKKDNGGLENQLEKKTTELQSLKESFALLQNSVESKNWEIAHLKQKINENSADIHRHNDSFELLQQNVESKNLEIARLNQVLKESNEQLAKFALLNENFGQLQQNLQSKNLEISQLQQIIHESNHREELNKKESSDEYYFLQNKFQELQRNLEDKSTECSNLSEEINRHQEKLRDVETKWKKEKIQRTVEKKSLNAEIKTLSQRLKKMEKEVQKAVENRKVDERDIEVNLLKIQQLESTIHQMQTEIETRELRLAELQNVINWKDEQYQKIQVSLQTKFNEERTALQEQVRVLHYQNIEKGNLHANKPSNTEKSNEPKNETQPEIETPLRNCERLEEPCCEESNSNEGAKRDRMDANDNRSAHVEDNLIDKEYCEKPSDIAANGMEANEEEQNLNTLSTNKNSALDRKEREEMEANDINNIQEIHNTPEKQSLTTLSTNKNSTPERKSLGTISTNKNNRKTTRRKEKKVARKRQNQKKKLQEWKSQIEAKENLKTPSPLRNKEEGKCTKSQIEAENNLQALSQTDDVSIAEQLWGFSDEDLDDEEQLIVGRKRKSAIYETIEESDLGPPTKKIRKSRRLEEKRVARLLKDKVD